MGIPHRTRAFSILLRLIPTVEYIEKAFRRYNDEIFGSQLKMPPIVLSNARTFLGMVSSRQKRTLTGRIRKYGFVLRISTRFDLSETQWDDVIIHEMIHCFIGYRQISDTSAHGVCFRKMMNEINERYNRHMTISSHMGKTVSAGNGTQRTTCFCHIRFKDGKEGVIPAAKTCVLEMRDRLAMAPDIAEAKWYVTRSPFFARFPRFRTLKYVSLKEGEFSEHISECKPVEFVE